MKNFISIKTKEYWDRLFGKMFSFAVSLKFLAMVSIMTISTILLVKGLIDGNNWVTINATMLPIVVVREVMKIENISKIIKKKEGNTDDELD